MDLDRGSRRTARLLLDPLRAEDAADVLRVYGDPGTWQHLPQGRMRDLGQARAQIEKSLVSRQNRGLGMWAVRILPHAADGTLEAGEFLGCGGVRYLEDAGVWNLGYRLSPRAWGRGFATEIAAAAREAALEADAGTPLTARALSSNPASVAVLEKIGLRLVGERPFPDAPPATAPASLPATAPAPAPASSGGPSSASSASDGVPRERIYADRRLNGATLRRLLDAG